MILAHMLVPKSEIGIATFVIYYKSAEALGISKTNLNTNSFDIEIVKEI